MFFLASDAFATLSTFKKCGTVFLYLTIGLVVLTVIIGILIKHFDKDKLSDFSKYSTGIGVGYSFAISGIMLFLKFDEMIAEGEFIGAIFWPIFALLALIVILSMGGLILSIIHKKHLRLYAIASFFVAVVYTIALLVVQLVKSYKDNFVLGDELGLMFSLIALAVLVVLLLTFFGKKTLLENNTKSIVYAAVCIAMSFALSYIRFFRLPQGGSITFVSLLPLMIYSHIFGIRKGVLAGFIYGLLQAIQDPWIVHPIQFLLDYPVAFCMIGFAGIFKSFPKFKDNIILKFIVGGIFCSILRYACHVITGIIVFKAYAPSNFNAVAWGFLYNLFVFADIAIAIVAGGILLSSKSFVKQMSGINT